MQERMEESKKLDETSSELENIRSRQREYANLKRHISQQEHELQEKRAHLSKQQLDREREFQKELEERDRIFSTRERSLYIRQREMEELLANRQREAEELKAKLEIEVANRERQLAEAMAELELEKERYTLESRKKIETSSKDYVASALEVLRVKEEDYHARSRWWTSIGALSLLVGLFFFIYITVDSAYSLPNPLSWQFVVFSTFKGLVGIGLFAAVSRYAFVLGNSYMREALRNGDRRHAINFGKFYLESYGAAADWNQIKDAFEHWNIGGANGFGGVDDAKVSFSLLEKVSDLMKSDRESNAEKSQAKA